jgi:hypothetical protein
LISVLSSTTAPLPKFKYIPNTTYLTHQLVDQSKMSDIFKGIGNLIASIFQVIEGAISAVINTVVTAFQTVFSVIVGAFKSVFSLAEGVVGLVVGKSLPSLSWYLISMDATMLVSILSWTGTNH